MSVALTINESKLLAKLIDSFKDKDKLNDEHTLIKALSKKSSLSDSDVKKLKLLLAAEKSKILAKENKRKAKAAVKLDQQERQSYIENRQKRFGMVFGRNDFSNAQFLLMLTDITFRCRPRRSDQFFTFQVGKIFHSGIFCRQ